MSRPMNWIAKLAHAIPRRVLSLQARSSSIAELFHEIEQESWRRPAERPAESRTAGAETFCSSSREERTTSLGEQNTTGRLVHYVKSTHASVCALPVLQLVEVAHNLALALDDAVLHAIITNLSTLNL